MRHLITLADITPEEFAWLLKLSMKFKYPHKHLDLPKTVEEYIEVLRDKYVALIFEKPSTRTRVSLEVAIRELHANPIYLNWNELQLGRGEPIRDTVIVLSRYVDCIVARVKSHETLVEMTRYSRIPIVNALSDRFHPLQAIADMMTIMEKKNRLKGVNIAFIGDGGSNVAHSLILASTLVGANINIACPMQYKPLPEVLKAAENFSKLTGSKVRILEDPLEAVRNVDVVYTDVFVSMGFEHERDIRLRTFIPKYRVTRELIENAHEDVIFMHCLPARRGEEVTREVIDDPSISVVFDQAENRLYTAKAVLIFVMTPSSSLFG
ncbi:MAG: ornithine carbamoyltransferase [Thermoprotei archaeon]|nr:MAG: ornithine carbamoyltransferase [Thermoprotei archaeon]